MGSGHGARRFGLIGLLVVLGALACAQWADASGWTVEPVPAPQVPNGQLNAISCSSSTSCVAVGSYDAVPGQLAPMAERWDGSSWKLQGVPMPSGEAQSTLLSVSCSSASACVAVGYSFNNSTSDAALVESWNGAAWAVQSTPMLSAANQSSLEGVSCASATVCTAVGYEITTSGVQTALVEAWDGVSWSVAPLPDPAPSSYSELKGVSCPSVDACTAVGSYFSSSANTYLPLVERSNGSAWDIQPAPRPSHSHLVSFHGVTCPTADRCTAVGEYLSSAGAWTKLAEAWNGTGWKIEPTAQPSGATRSSLDGVACSSANACSAVGSYFTATGERLFAEVWDGVSWKIPGTRQPAGATGSLFSGVSCLSSAVCTAVGTSYGSDNVASPLAETQAGTSWTIQPTAEANGSSSNSSIDAVSCPTATACDIVGGFFTGGDGAALSETWNGSTWRIDNPPALRGSLDGISCVTATSCQAVGMSTNGAGGNVTLAERWNGTAWTRESIPRPGAATESVLWNLSCASQSACTAVGSWNQTNGTEVKLAERWNGTSWKIQPTPNHSGALGSGLMGVSCWSATGCTAVGGWDNSADRNIPLAETWNGIDWAVQAAPPPSGTRNAGFESVSCRSAAACVATGSYDTSSKQVALTEIWNGTSWTIEPAAIPAGAKDTDLGGVSCPSTTSCTAVGFYDITPGDRQPLAEHWNGTSWTIQTTPSPSSTTSTRLTSVSCATSTSCLAGGYSNGAAFAERFTAG